MKKYIFFTSDIYPVGGIQIYLSGKIKFLEKKGWKIYVFFNTFHKGNCVFPKLNEFKNGKFECLSFLPNELGEKVVDYSLKKMLNYINYADSDDVLIESHYDVTALWAELFAEKTKGKHVCLCCNEVFRGTNKYYEKFIDFFKYKYDRNELLGISSESMQKLFYGRFDSIPIDDSHVFKAAADNPIQEIKNEVIDKIKRKEFNICYIGRAGKQSFLPILDGVNKFIKNVGNVYCQFIIVADTSADEVKRIEELFSEIKNVNLIFTGTLSPVPKRLFELIDVTVASSGCAIMSANEGIPTVLVDANDYKSNGLFGYDTENFLYREKDGLCEDIEKTLEKVFNKEYLGKQFKLNRKAHNELYYNEHLKYFDLVDHQYYNKDCIINTCNISIVPVLKIIYYRYLKNLKELR